MKRLAHLAVVLTAAGALLAACSRPSDLPDGNVSRTKVDFQAPAAGGNPTAETLFVSNSGRGTLEAPTVTISYQDGTDWLTATVTASGDRYAIAVQPVTTGLAAGTYRATLTLSWPSGSADPAVVSVTLVVPARTQGGPRMTLSRTSVALQAAGASGDPQVEEVWVANDGGGTLPTPTVAISYQDGAGWLAASVSMTGAPYDVTVKAATEGLAPGVYRATVTLACEGASASPAQVNVTLTVPDARFDLSVDALAIDAPRGGGDPAPMALHVVNAGRGTIPVPSIEVAYAGTATGWLTTSVAAAPDGYGVTAQARAAGIPSGVHKATLTVHAPGAAVPPRTLPVTFTVPPPEIAPSSQDVALRAPPRGADVIATIAVANGGGGLLATPVATVTYEGGSAASWDGMLEVAVSGTPALYQLGLTAHQVRSSAEGSSKLPPGTYTATVQVSAPGAAASDAVRVTLEVPAPVMLPSTSAVAFADYTSCPLPAHTAVAITNAGAGTLAAPVVGVDEGGKAWLDASVDSAGQDTATIRLALKAFPIADPGGSARTTVQISDPTGAASPVQLEVRFDALRPDLSTATVSPAQVDVRTPRGAGDPAAQTLSLVTPSGCFAQPAVEVEYANAAEPAWISSIVIASSPHRHDVSVLTTVAGLEPGERRAATLHLRVGGSTWDVPATQTLAVAPAGPLMTRRFSTSGTAVLTPLADGRALLTGGGYGNELFDPATRTWTIVNTPDKERSGHGAVQLDDGRVLVCGGHLIPGGTDSSACEVLAGTQWSSLGSLTTARVDVTLVTMPRGRVLVVSSLATPEVLDLATGRSTPLDGVSGTVAAKRADGSIMLAGAGNTTWLYSPDLDTWAATGDLAIVRQQPALIPLLDGRVMAIGGTTTSDTRTQLWDPRTGTWSIGPRSSMGHDRSSVVLLSSGKVMATNGFIVGTGSGYTDLEVFDPATGTWSVVGTYAQTGRSSMAIARLSNGVVVFAGGNLSSPFMSATETFTW